MSGYGQPRLAHTSTRSSLSSMHSTSSHPPVPKLDFVREK